MLSLLLANYFKRSLLANYYKRVLLANFRHFPITFGIGPLSNLKEVLKTGCRTKTTDSIMFLQEAFVKALVVYIRIL